MVRRKYIYNTDLTPMLSMRLELTGYSVRRVCLPVCLSVRPHGTTRLQLDEFSRNFDISVFFENFVEEIQVPLKSDKTDALHEYQFTFMITSR